MLIHLYVVLYEGDILNRLQQKTFTVSSVPCKQWISPQGPTNAGQEEQGCSLGPQPRSFASFPLCSCFLFSLGFSLNSFLQGSSRKRANSRTVCAVSHATWVLGTLAVGAEPRTALSSQWLGALLSVFPYFFLITLTVSLELLNSQKKTLRHGMLFEYIVFFF